MEWEEDQILIYTPLDVREHAPLLQLLCPAHIDITTTTLHVMKSTLVNSMRTWADGIHRDAQNSRCTHSIAARSLVSISSEAFIFISFEKSVQKNKNKSVQEGCNP